MLIVVGLAWRWRQFAPRAGSAFDALQDTIRQYNSKAKGIIDSMGR